MKAPLVGWDGQRSKCDLGGPEEPEYLQGGLDTLSTNRPRANNLEPMLFFIADMDAGCSKLEAPVLHLFGGGGGPLNSFTAPTSIPRRFC